VIRPVPDPEVSLVTLQVGAKKPGERCVVKKTASMRPRGKEVPHEGRITVVPVKYGKKKIAPKNKKIAFSSE